MDVPLDERNSGVISCKLCYPPSHASVLAISSVNPHDIAAVD